MATPAEPPAHDTPPPGFSPVDEQRHLDAAVEEWWFSAWATDGAFGLLSWWRLVGDVGWYWSALARRGEPLLHMTEWSVPRRADPMIAKAPEMWAEIECVAAFDQWTVGNEMYAVALDDPNDALGRAHGHVTPVAMDLEWYAIAPAEPLEPAASGAGRGYRQRGVLHGVVELPVDAMAITEVAADRWHRWGASLVDVPLAAATAHLGLRAPVRLPDGTTIDLVLTADGWRRRDQRLGYRRVAQ